jgi:starch-binding outer membrane protein, SusD/RagB family
MLHFNLNNRKSNIMYKITFLLVALVALFASCTKESSGLLDPATSVLDDKQVFSSAPYADQYLNDIYGWLVPVYATTGNAGTRWRGTDALLEVSTDNGSSNLGGTFRTFNTGAYSAALFGGMFWYSDWQQSFQAIRACNLYLKHIDDVPLDLEYSFDEPTRTNRKAEAVFLKAWFYAELCKEFGGLPLMDEPLDIAQNMELPRSTYDETVVYIVKLCDQAAAVLPNEYPDYQLGRVTKGAALALKARTLLYAASPLWNNSAKPEDSPFRGKYDPNKWRVAAEACKAVIDFNNTNHIYSLDPDISSMFLIYNQKNPEWIFEHRMRNQAYMTYISIPVGMWSAKGPTKTGCNQVTYNMVKQYEVIKNGKAYSIDDANSGYNPNDPYKNRDPRFYRDCMFNGSKYQGRTAVLGVNGPDGTVKTFNNPAEISPYYTYVFSIKFADLTLTANGTGDGRNPSGISTTGSNYPYIRYAEVLLDYAEAMNEAFGPEVDGLGNGYTAWDAVNEVRTRAAYQPKGEYMGYTGSMPQIEKGLLKEQMRAKIHHERRVEFTFEEHRFWDCRRWKEAPDADIQAQTPTWGAGGTITYPISTIETRPWFSQFYRMPIPENETFSDPNLEQNPGYNLSKESSED